MKQHSMQHSALHLVPCPIATDGKWHFDEEIISVLKKANMIVCERIRTTRRMIRSLYDQAGFDQIEFIEIDKHSGTDYVQRALAALIDQKDVLLMSEAGMPCIADPGYALVQAAHRKKIVVRPYAGPCSFIMALMASGLPGQQFTFHGYLSRDPQEMQKELKTIERSVLQSGQSQIFMETPYRNQKLFDSVLRIVNGALLLNISMDITGSRELIKTARIQDWKKQPIQFNEKYPAVFIIGKSNI